MGKHKHKYVQPKIPLDSDNWEYGMGSPIAYLGGLVGAITNRTPDCSHWRTEVAIGEYTVYASSTRAFKADNLLIDPIPEVGIYLDDYWMRKLTGFAAVGMPSPVKWHWPFVVIDWPDMGVMSDAEIKLVINVTVKAIKGGKRVEIACMGGHGRTGTLLAMLRTAIGKMSAKEAIESLRKDYCKKIVESGTQVKAVFRLAGEDEESADAKALSPSKSY